jgi:histidinol-phosphate/aromatic aminotransferase/cobyric acid decarboxylase-like protein
VVSAVYQQLEAIDRYPTPGYASLRQALGEFHQIGAEWILPGNGAAELLTWAGRDLASLPATLLPVPAFNDYDRALTASGARVERRSLIDASGHLTDLSEILIDIPLGWGLLCNNPHNPTGQIFDPAILPDLLDRFALVVVDESFMDFVRPEQSAIPLVDHYPNLLVIRSLTKFYSLPGLRLGYAIGHPDRLRQWQSWRDPWAVNSLAAAAALAAIADREFIAATHRWYTTNQPEMYRELQQISALQIYPSSANFFLMRSPTVPFPALQQQLLQEYQILIRDCLSFPELGEAYGRVALKQATENQRLVAALAAVLSR